MVGVSCQIVDLCSELITALAARLYCRNFFPERMTCADYLTAILCVDADVTRYDPVCGESLPKEPEERNEGALRREPNFSRQTRLPFLMRNFWLAIQTKGSDYDWTVPDRIGAWSLTRCRAPAWLRWYGRQY